MMIRAHTHERRSQAGMSLAEVLVATAIFAIIFVAALLVYDRSNQVFNRGVQAADAQQNTRIAFDKMVSDLRMTGFDFDRDGLPAVSGQSQQPDEQIEYAGPSAITLRANFNYEDQATDGGRITALESPNSEFPVVTTGNDEIVTYALVSDDPSKNTDTIEFYADVTDGTNEARQSYPGPGGQPEDLVTISGVDLCDDGNGCVNPPYTLYRFTLQPDGTATRTPLANNIRSMRLNYFANAGGTTPLTITDAGGGRWDPVNPQTSAAQRAMRAQIRAMELELIGMNEARDGAYTNPDEPLPAFAQYRTYRLDTLISPRNIGKRGLTEQASASPGQPTLDWVEFGYCGSAQLRWTQPPFSTNTGLPDGYAILWDTNVGGTGQPANARPTGIATSYLLTGLDPATQYRFSIAAVNSYGTTYSDQFVTGTPKNRTDPEPPSNLQASGGNGIPEETDEIHLSWELPEDYVAGQRELVGIAPSGAQQNVPAPLRTAEFRDIEIWRSRDVNFQPPGAGTRIGRVSGSATTFVDTSAAGCIPYYYRIRIVEACADAAGFNEVGSVGRSDWSPALATSATPGQATSQAVPLAPATLRIDPDPALTNCMGSGERNCRVMLEWPQVVESTDGNPIGIEEYSVEISRNGSFLRAETVTRTSGTFENGLVRYQVALKQKNETSGLDYSYEMVVRARQICSDQLSDPSPAVVFPLCDFGPGAAIDVHVEGAFTEGSGTTPWQVTSPSRVVLTTSPLTTFASASAYAYDAATGAPVADLGTVNNANQAGFPWEWGAQDDVVYRVDYFVTDTSGCTTSGNLYIQEVAVPCGLVDKFDNPDLYDETDVSDLEREIDIKLRNEYGVGTAPSADLVITGIRFEYDQEAARRVNGGHLNVVQSVGFPRIGGGTPVAATRDTSLSGNGIEVWTVSGAANLITGDQTGNYQVRVRFQYRMGINVQPITHVTIFYRIANVDEPGTVRQCEIDP